MKRRRPEDLVIQRPLRMQNEAIYQPCEGNGTETETTLEEGNKPERKMNGKQSKNLHVTTRNNKSQDCIRINLVAISTTGQ